MATDNWLPESCFESVTGVDRVQHFAPVNNPPLRFGFSTRLSRPTGHQRHHSHHDHPTRLAISVENGARTLSLHFRFLESSSSPALLASYPNLLYLAVRSTEVPVLRFSGD
ncbi:hypothetical protein KFK09_028951 [Dendrobium nobile]|uniref:Uncharacterized protein n=1 Tax=Dendrobium nobile TaxID=94219 RepID=A0A8T3A508_DENNO|nr:hypothetical protein KFK09_028951 [Dendrobium nobile]